MPTLRKNAYGLVHVHLCNGVATSLPWKLLRTYLESCANIVAVVYRPPSCRPRAGPPSSARPPPAALLPAIIPCSTLFAKNLSKSTLAHDVVAAAVLHKHHPIICVGAGLIHFVYGSRSYLANGGYPSQKCVFAIFARVFFYRVFRRVARSLSQRTLSRTGISWKWFNRRALRFVGWHNIGP